jgi:hypothetical protein
VAGEHELYELKDCWEPPDYPAVRRYVVEIDRAPSGHRDAILASRSIDPAEWVPPQMRVLSGGDSPEDLPFAGWWTHVVSDRLRAALERLAPGHAQFLPVIAPAENHLAPYWAAIWLHMYDCLDERRAIIVHMGEERRPTVFKVAVDASKVPPEIAVCRVARAMNSIVVRSHIVRELEGMNFTGILCEPV